MGWNNFCNLNCNLCDTAQVCWSDYISTTQLPMTFKFKFTKSSLKSLLSEQNLGFKELHYLNFVTCIFMLLDFHKTNPNIQVKKTLLKKSFHPNMRDRSRSDVKVRKLASKPQLKHNDELESSLSRFRRTVGAGGLGEPWPPPSILVDRLNLFKAGGQSMPITLLAPPNFQTFLRPCSVL